MNIKISPFTTTPGIAGKAYINNHIADEIIANYESNYSTQYVYKILGLRGSGKSVEYQRVMAHFAHADNWKVYALAAGGDPLSVAISAISREPEVNALIKKTEISTTGALEGSAAILKGNLETNNKTIYERPYEYISKEYEFERMCEEVCSQGNKILIGIDDIAITEPMIEFLSIIGKLLLNPNINIRLLTTGLEKNMEEFIDVPHLSFFARTKAMIVSPLNKHDVTRMYQNLLCIDTTTATNLAEITKGYAWGYQLLGDEYYNQTGNKSLENILFDFDQRMAPTYDLIWQSLTHSEREFVKKLIINKTGKKEELEKIIKGYSQHRNNLKKKHIINTSIKGYISIDLPRFAEYVEAEHM